MSYGSSGYPGGKTGVYSNLAGVKFDSPVVESPDPSPEYLGRWEGAGYQSAASGSLGLYNGPRTGDPPYLKNLRLQKFQATFSITTMDTTSCQRAFLVFNGVDNDNWQAAVLTSYSSPAAPGIYVCTNGVYSIPSYTAAALPP